MNNILSLRKLFVYDMSLCRNACLNEITFCETTANYTFCNDKKANVTKNDKKLLSYSELVQNYFFCDVRDHLWNVCGCCDTRSYMVYMGCLLVL